MKFKFYLLPLLLFYFVQSKAQDCSALSFTYSVTESRCVATGSILITTTGGSGNYNFKAVGPISTPLTSSNNITGLPTGYYTLFVKDLTTGCTKEIDSAFVPGSYSDPRFQLTKTDVGCAGSDGTISVNNQQYGRSPFTYSIISPSPSNIGATNTSGNFSGLSAGEYFIQLQDSCGGIQVRRITIETYNWWFDLFSVTKIGCDSADVFIRLKDNKGNTNTSGTAFTGFSYGVVISAGDTAWYLLNDFHIFLGTKRNLTIVAKDNCGNVHSTMWYVPDSSKPSAGTVSLTNLLCSTFTATLSGIQNIPNPQYCLYNSITSLNIECNANGIFTNVPYGSYCISVYDNCYDTTIKRCFVVNHGTPSVDPSVSISNQNCTTFTASITGQNNLTRPNFCLYDSDNAVIRCNVKGIFANIPYGSYCIKISDDCTDTTISRCFTVIKPLPILTGYTITGSNCSSFNVSASGNNLIAPLYCLYDSLGNVVACDSAGIFTGINHGQYCIRAISCGDTTNSLCFTSSIPVPSVASSVTITQRKCSTFSVSVTGQSNLTNAGYCLYNSSGSLIVCDSTGIFNDIPYGSYCIKIHDGCMDTIIQRCFTEVQPIPSINGSIQLLGSTCSTISIQATGSNLTNPAYCLYNAVDSLFYCNTTGIFNSIPYGQYCVTIHDGCVDTTMKVCQTFAPVRGIAVTTSKSCTIGTAYVDINFSNANAPYTVSVYHPNGSVVYSTTTSANPLRMQLAALPTGIKYKIVTTDNCGNKDTAFIAPDANLVTKTTTVKAKCPSAAWLNGSGDILAAYTSNYNTVIPQIIKKNGANFMQSYSSVSGNTYTFADMEPAEYIVAYTQQSCNSILYDTVTVPTYSYPSQGQSAIYQCDNNGFTLNSDVHGGVSPYTYQIIGSTPNLPNITTTTQTNPVFSINNGTTYSLVRSRAIDACGNATLNDVSVLPLQNISIAASATCFYQNITLSTDTVPNATYLWYRKTSPSDSMLLDSGLTYNLPFFLPEQAGDYVCKMSVNNGCLTRLSSFSLNGSCYALLAVSLEFKGRATPNGNQLYWINTTEKNVVSYIVERKTQYDKDFGPIGSLPYKNNNYLFIDNNPAAGTNMYRLKIMYAVRSEYSNVVSLHSSTNAIIVYPNPAKDIVHIALTSDKATNYIIELIGTNGQMIYTNELKNITTTTITYTKNKNLAPGIYLMRITNTNNGRTEVFKILFE